MTSGSLTNQGPQQWDQSGPVNNQSGQSPHSTVPQDQYAQMDQQGHLQNGKVLYNVQTIFYEQVESQSV